MSSGAVAEDEVEPKEDCESLGSGSEIDRLRLLRPAGLRVLGVIDELGVIRIEDEGVLSTDRVSTTARTVCD